VDTQLQQAVDAWADEQNEAANSASARLICTCLVEPQLRPSSRVLCGAT